MSPRNLDSVLQVHLGDPVIFPCVFAEITFKSGVEHVWSGVGDFVGPEGKTFSGVGQFASVGAIGEGSDVKAEGTTVTLNGIGDSLLDVPGVTFTNPDPPRATAPGEHIAWVYPQDVAFASNRGSAVATAGGAPGTASLRITSSRPLDNGLANAEWSGWDMPLEVPDDAVITSVYGVLTYSNNGVTLSTVRLLPLHGGGTIFNGSGGQPTGTYYSGDIGPALPDTFNVEAADSLFEDGLGEAIDVTYLALAVYYTGTPRTKLSMLHEALLDIWIGAPVKLWYGQMDGGGALLGVPYLVFSGLVDKPSVHIGTDTISITLKLENRLVNLQRANQRRYTAADQKIYYPTDTAFNSVESLNDISLRWGN